LSWHQIITELNSQGRKTKAGGDVIRIPGGVPAIVDEETIRRVQEKMASNRRYPQKYISTNIDFVCKTFKI
jgi:hypothetical protein